LICTAGVLDDLKKIGEQQVREQIQKSTTPADKQDKKSNSGNQQAGGGHSSGAANQPPAEANSAPPSTPPAPQPVMAAQAPPPTASESAASPISPPSNANSPLEWGEPRITLTPLPQIQAAYDGVKDDSICESSFQVSADGKHYVTIKRSGLKAFCVDIDGKAGGEYQAITNLRVNSDLSTVVYTAVDKTTTKNVVEQKRDGSSRVCPINQPVGNWTLSEGLSLDLVQLVYSRIEPDPTGHNYRIRFIRIGDGPEIGPFPSSADSDAAFIIHRNPAGSHALLMGVLRSPLNIAGSVKLACFLDGKEIAADFMPKPSMARQSIMGSGLVCWDGPTAKGSYLIRSPNGIIFNGNRIASAEGRDFKFAMISPDELHSAYAAQIGTQWRVLYDGKPLPGNYASITEMKFSGDSRSLLFAEEYANKTAVYADGQQIAVENNGVSLLIAGPTSTRYAYLARDEHSMNVLVRNGSRTPLKGMDISSLRFSSDGKHVIAVGQLWKTLTVDASTIDMPPVQFPRLYDGQYGTFYDADPTHVQLVVTTGGGAGLPPKQFKLMTLAIVPAPDDQPHHVLNEDQRPPEAPTVIDR
jgi:hypothetical protein